MHDQRDHDRTDPVEQRLDECDRAESLVEICRRQNDRERRQNEGAAGDPGAEDAATDVPDVDSDLNRQRTRQGLADCEAFEIPVSREPLPPLDQVVLHDRDESRGASKPEGAQPEKVRHELGHRHVCTCRRSRIASLVSPLRAAHGHHPACRLACAYNASYTGN